MKLSERFPRYTDFDPLVPVWCVTPGVGRTIHRFFDTSPFSPSGRYLALFRLPQEERDPAPGEAGEVVVVDLAEGEERVVAETRGWETQVGAHVQWGADDRSLFFNDVDPCDWSVVGVLLDPVTGARRSVPGGVYAVSPDGRTVAMPRLNALRITQGGYGVVVPDGRVARNRGLSDDDGLYLTDVDTGRRRLLVSIRDCVEKAVPESDLRDLGDHDFYGFSCKWNARGTRLTFSIRAIPASLSASFNVMNGHHAAIRHNLFTVDAGGNDIRLAVPARLWARGGHHQNWCPDGEHLSMNLNVDGETPRNRGIRFASFRYDGSGLRKLADRVIGTGHPTVHPDGRHLLTDAYAVAWDPCSCGDGTVPLRWVDLDAGSEQRLVRIRAATEWPVTRWTGRVDPHPAWDETWTRIAFNACPDGTRRVFVADLAGVM